MRRVVLTISLVASLLMPGAIGLHVHADGTCHSHPFDEHEDEDEDSPVALLFASQHSASDTQPRPAWFAEDAGACKAMPTHDIAETHVVDRLDPPHSRAPARASPIVEHDSIPLFLRQLHILI